MNKEKFYVARSDAEAKALADGTQTVIVIPLRPQPVLTFKTGSMLTAYWWKKALFDNEKDMLRYCPYMVGEQIAVREPWNPRHRNRRRPVIATPTCKSIDCREQDGRWQWFIEARR